MSHYQTGRFLIQGGGLRLFGCTVWTVPWWARRARARPSTSRHPGRPPSSARRKYFWAPSHAVTQSSRTDGQSRGGKETGRRAARRKAEPEICEWCGTYRVVFLSKPTSNGSCCGHGRRVVRHCGPNSETTLTKNPPCIYYHEGRRDRSEPALLLA